MYLWKYWRETRILFGVVLAAIALLFLAVLKEPTATTNGSIEQISMVAPVMLFIQAVPVGFIGWLLGSFGAGRDLGEKSGSFLFTRPRPREYFVWRDWAFGAAEILVLVTLLNLVLALQVHRLIFAVGDPLHGSIVLAGETFSLPAIVALNTCAAFLLGALLFSATYFSTILVKHSRGLLVGAGAVLGYFVLGGIISHYWPEVHLPSLLLSAYSMSHHSGALQKDGLGISIAVRTIVVLLFPLAAQLVLRKADL